MNNYERRGGANIFDLSKEYNFTDNVQKNIASLYEMFGESFSIRNETSVMPVNLRLLEGYFNGGKFFELNYNEPERTYVQVPFSIWFYDIKTNSLNNDTYIAYIHGTKNHSGTEIMNMVLDVQRKLKVHKTILHDGSTIGCHNDRLSLSYFKLLEKGETYYMRFGFDVEPLQHYACEVPFNSKEEWHYKINEILENIKKIKVEDIALKYKKSLELINKVNETKDYENFKIKYLMHANLIPYDYYFEDNIVSKVNELHKAFTDILTILKETDETYLHPYLLKLFKDKELCKKYSMINKYIMTTKLIEITYDNESVYFDHIIPFKLLSIAQAAIHYAYYF